MTDTWEKYYDKTKNNSPRPLLVEAVKLVKDKNNALDLGAGALNDTQYLLSEGFNHITAVDNKPMAEEIIHLFPKGKVQYEIKSFEEFLYEKEKYDIVNAQYSLPFNPSSTFNKIILNIIESLKGEGVFVGQFFGINDEWNTGKNNMTFHTRAEATKLLSGMRVVSFKEEEADRKTALGKMKHWHIFHFIAVK